MIINCNDVRSFHEVSYVVSEDKANWGAQEHLLVLFSVLDTLFGKLFIERPPSEAGVLSMEVIFHLHALMVVQRAGLNLLAKLEQLEAELLA